MGNTIIGAASGEIVFKTTPKDSQSQATGQKKLDITFMFTVIITEIGEIIPIFFNWL